MTRIFIDGFEGGNSSLWDTAVAYPGTEADAVDEESFYIVAHRDRFAYLTGNYCLALVFGKSATKNINLTTTYFGLLMLTPVTSGSPLYDDAAFILLFYDTGGSFIARVVFSWVSSASELTVSVYDKEADLVTTDVYTAYNNAVHIQVLLDHLSPTSKRVAVKVDGHTQIDTTFSNDSATTELSGSIVLVNNITTYCYLDNFVIDNSEWPGETEIYGLIPISDVQTGWAATAPNADEYSVGAAADVGYWTASIFTTTGTNVLVSSLNSSFFLFQGINVVSGESISNAYLTLSALNDYTPPLELPIYCNSADNAVAPTTINEANALDLTANVSWDLGEWSSSPAYDSPDLSSLIQAVIDRPGWERNNNLMLIIGNGSGTSRDVWSHIGVPTTPQLTISKVGGHAAVDETPPNTTDYIYSATPGAVSLFGVTDLANDGQTIKCVQAQAYGSCMVGESFQVAINASGETHFGNSGEMTEAYEYARSIWGNNPTSSGEWTFNDVQSLQVGAKLIEI